MLNGAPKIRYRRVPVTGCSRPQRWRDAVAELVELQDEYMTWLDSAACQSGRTAPRLKRLRAICDFDLSELGERRAATTRVRAGLIRVRTAIS